MRVRISFVATLAAASVACTQPQPDPVPVADPVALAERLRTRATPEQSQLIEFEWRYRGRDGRFTGDGGLRVNPPDSVRLDLLGPGWSGVQSAVMLGDDVYYLGEQRVALPPPTFMWTMLGAFRPPVGIVPEGSRRGERTELFYRLSPRETVAFYFEGSGQLVEAELLVDGDAVQTIKVEPGDAVGSGTGHRWPVEARYRDLGEFHEVRIKVTGIRNHERFEGRIFQVASR